MPHDPINLVERVRSIFAAALDQPPEQRTAFLDRACDRDDLRAEVDDLLRHYERRLTVLSGADPAPALTAPRRIAAYEILDVLGSGGMGVVYRARQSRPNREVALKVLRSGVLHEEALARFSREAEVLGKLQHPGIAQIHDAGTFDDGQGPQPFFAMELVDGESLTDYADRRQLDARGRGALLAQVCDAVQHAHERGVIHRDLKPGNILVTEPDADAPQPKVLDFGIARTNEPDGGDATVQTRTGVLVGTLAYMSPEQLSGGGREIDQRTDVYALGVILYQLLTRELPLDLDGLSLTDVVRMVQDDEPSPLGAHDTRLRGDLDTIAATALAKEPERRYVSPAALASDLRRYLAHEPIRARPQTTWYQLKKFARRNKTLVAGASSTALVLFAGAIVSVVFGLQANANAEVAREEATRALAFGSLLQQAISTTNPRRKKGPDYTLREVLEDFDESIGDQLVDQPLVEASVRETMGAAFAGLSLLDRAEHHLRRADELRTAHQDALAPDVIKLRFTLAKTLAEAGQIDEAESMVQDLAEIAAGHPELAPHRANALAMLAGHRTALGDHAAAERLYREAIAADERASLGPQVRALALNGLGNSLAAQKKLDQAEKHLRAGLAAYAEAEGEQSANYARSLNNLAWLMFDRGDLDAAEELFVQSLELRRRRLGEDHPDVGTALNNLADLRDRRGDLAGAEEYARQSVAIYEAAGRHQNLPVCQHTLARILRKRSSLEESEQLYRKALTAFQEQRGPRARWTINTQVALAGVLTETDQHEAALGMWRDVWKQRGKAFPAGHRYALVTARGVERNMRALGRDRDAERWQQRAEKIEAVKR